MKAPFPSDDTIEFPI